MKVCPDEYINALVDGANQSMAYTEDNNYFEWKKAVRQKFIELLGIDQIAKNAGPLNVDIEHEIKKDGYTEIRFTFEPEIGAVCPCYLLIPDTGKEKYPVVITLQGHSSGFHNSVGIAKSEGDQKYIDGEGAYALHAVKEGYVALALEQRGMGERRPVAFNRQWAKMCAFSAEVNFMCGRTLAGERAWDISRAIDALAQFKVCDLDKIVLTGSSGGGTATFYAGCYDERIKIVAPSCAFCTYKDSILDMFHCACNYIPDMYNYFEMQDLTTLIAPREFIVFAGEKDEIFPLNGVKEAFAGAQKIFEREGVPNSCQLIVHEGYAHNWVKQDIFPAFRKTMQKLGWLK